MGLTDVTLSPELGKQHILPMDGLEKAGLLAYGYLPLMQLRNCPAQPCPRTSASPSVHPSASPPNQPSVPSSASPRGLPPCVLTDRLGKRFPLTCLDGITTLHNCVPLYIGDKRAPFAARLKFFTLYFTTESPKECEAVTRSFLDGTRLNRETTGGLYFR
jgi:putative protease